MSVGGFMQRSKAIAKMAFISRVKCQIMDNIFSQVEKSYLHIFG